MRRLVIYLSAFCASLMVFFAASHPAGSLGEFLVYWVLAGIGLFAVIGVVILERLTKHGLFVAIGLAVASVVLLKVDGEWFAGFFIVFVFFGPITILFVLLCSPEGLPERRSAFAAIGMFILSHASLPFAPPVAMRLFDGTFETFAADVRSGDLPSSERFRVGPYMFDGVCAYDDGDVILWTSEFMAVAVLRISSDGDMSSGGGKGEGLSSCRS